MAVLVIGAAGFIGSNLIRHLLERWPERRLVSLDALTYSGHLGNLVDVLDHEGHSLIEADITNPDAVRRVFERHDIDGVIHLAAESHVDRSIVDALAFARSNVIGTVVLLQQAAESWAGRQDVRFHHVSIDEVFGILGADGHFDESSRYHPNSPYAASKAGSDHFVRAWLALVFERGAIGATYCIGGEAEFSNLELVGMVLDELDVARGLPVGTSRDLIEFVTDRPRSRLPVCDGYQPHPVEARVESLGRPATRTGPHRALVPRPSGVAPDRYCRLIAGPTSAG